VRGEEHEDRHNWGGTVGSLVTGLGGSSDQIVVSFKGGANNAHMNPVFQEAATTHPPRSIFIKSFFTLFRFLFASAFSSPSLAFFVLSLSFFLSLSLSLTVGVSVSFPPCRAYNVRPDRTWIRRRAGSFLTNIFGYPHRLESDL